MKSQSAEMRTALKRLVTNTGCAVALLISGIPANPMWAWSPAMQSAATGDRLKFDTASVKPSKSADEGGAYMNLGRPGGHVKITKFSLRMLMGQAFDLPSLSDALNSIFGMPNWGDSEPFDIESVVEGSPGISEKKMMLQSLLADRFKLVVHHESRQRPVFALIMVKPGKYGPQLRPPTDEATCEKFLSGRAQSSPLHPGAKATPAISPSDAAKSALEQFPCGRVVGGLLPGEPNQIWSGGRNVTLETIAASLGGMELFDRPVLDRTKVMDKFDFTVEWSSMAQSLSISPPNDPSRLSLIEALKEQLGLKLVPQTGPVGVLVIDHVERPTPN